jgi:Peptidase C39 family
MSDIYFGIAVVLALSVIIFLAALILARKLKKWEALLLMTVAVGFLILHALVLLDNIRLARLLPFSNLIVVGNFSPLATAVIAALAWRYLSGSVIRRGAFLMLLIAVCMWKAYSPVFESPPTDLTNVWLGNVCLQSSTATCSPAAAATLLHHYGIETNEIEMSRLCLTSDHGTSELGLYRGLNLKTAGTGWHVEPVTGTIADLQKMDGPVLLTVGLINLMDADQRYTTVWGWQPGVRHTIVLFKFTDNNRVEVGDPATGGEHWSLDGLRTLWLGEGFRLVRD